MDYMTDDWPSAPPMSALVNRVHWMDCFDLIACLPDKSVDAYITDLPYSTTSLIWDEIIPFAPMWREVKRTLKPRGVFVTTASQPFTSKLVMSNVGMFKYSWVWRKNRGSNPANARIMPMKEHEDICVFGIAGVNYFPQMKQRAEGGKSRAAYTINPSNTGKRQVMGNFIDTKTLNLDPDWRLPGSVIDFNTEVGLHPTQKPVALYEYLISTYTQAGELVVDFCCGSGTTALAARNLGRRFIAGDITPEYVQVARDRLAQPYTINFLNELKEVG